MKKTTVISTLAATALAMAPALAQEKPAPAPAKPAAPAQAKPAPKPQPKPEKKCLDTEIQNLEASLDKIGKALEQRMAQKEQQLAKSQQELAKTKAECDALRKQLKNSQAKNTNLATEFSTFKASNEKQRQATMATFAKVQESSKNDAKMIAELKQKHAAAEAHCKAACERLKQIVGNLRKVEADLSNAKK